MESRTILIATHERELRSQLRYGLQLGGFLVAEAVDGRGALDILHQEPPDLLLLDLRIPVVGSVALLAELRAIHSRPRPRATVITEPGDVLLGIEAIRLGASDFLEKPVGIEDAEASIASVLREAPNLDSPDREQGDVLEAVRVALQTGNYGAIDSALMSAGRICQAAYLNLAGVIHEAHGRLNGARSFYERARPGESSSSGGIPGMR
jgi:DNA-binding response OmpR family regulator